MHSELELALAIIAMLMKGRDKISWPDEELAHALRVASKGGIHLYLDVDTRTNMITLTMSEPVSGTEITPAQMEDLLNKAGFSAADIEAARKLGIRL